MGILPLEDMNDFPRSRTMAMAQHWSVLFCRQIQAHSDHRDQVQIVEGVPEKTFRVLL